MEIEFHNWVDGDVSNCRVVMVKGCLLENRTVATSECCEITVSLKGTTFKWPVLHGLFKSVIHLSKGVNLIDFSYQGINKSLELNFLVNDTDLCLVPLYIVCHGHDGRFQADENNCDNSLESACQRIALVTLLVQCLFAEKLRDKGHPRKTFQLEFDLDEDLPACRVFHSQLHYAEAWDLDQEDLWTHLGREIMTSDIGSEKKKYLAILSCTYWDGSKALGDPALGGGGLALLGSSTLYCWPQSLSDIVSFFTDQRKIPPSLQDKSCFRGTYAGCLSTSLGTVCHEVGHMFNLGHAATGIMSRGFDNVERVFLSIPSRKVIGGDNEDEIKNWVLLPCFSVSSGLASSTTKTGSVHSPTQPKEDDLTSLTSACAAILAHHKWFNGRSKEASPITYDPIRSIVSSDVGLKVVQLRGPCGAVLKSWELGSKSLHKHLILPRLKVSPTTLMAINSCGFILTQEI